MFISSFHWDEANIRPECDHLHHHLQPWCSNNNSIVTRAASTTPTSSKSMPLCRPPPLYSAFHNISVWKQRLNVPFIPVMKAWFMAAWQGEGHKEGGINTVVRQNTRVTQPSSHLVWWCGGNTLRPSMSWCGVSRSTFWPRTDVMGWYRALCVCVCPLPTLYSSSKTTGVVDTQHDWVGAISHFHMQTALFVLNLSDVLMLPGVLEDLRNNVRCFTQLENMSLRLLQCSVSAGAWSGTRLVYTWS